MNFIKLLLVSLLLGSTSYANTVLTCTSADFDPETFNGQSLTVKVNDKGIVIDVSKVEGSWFCDEGKVENPKLIKETEKARIYDVNFGCDEWNGRLITANAKRITWAKYAFSYTDDERNRRVSYNLTCK